MPADRLRRLRGLERPAAALPALSPLPPCCGPPQAVLRGAEGLRPYCCALVGALSPCRGPCRALLPGGLLLLPGGLLLLPGGPGCPPPPPPAACQACRPAAAPPRRRIGRVHPC